MSRCQWDNQVVKTVTIEVGDKGSGIGTDILTIPVRLEDEPNGIGFKVDRIA